MATEEYLAEEPEEEQLARKPKNKKLLIIIITCLVLLLVGAASTYFFVVKKMPVPFLHKEEKPEISIFDLGSIVVNLSEQGHYLRLTPVLEYTKNKELELEIKNKKSQIIDQMIITLRKKSVDKLMSVDTVDSIKQELLQSANACLQNGSFKRVYFVEFIIQ